MRNTNGEEFPYPFTLTVQPRIAGATERMISGLTRPEIVGDGMASTRLFWKNKSQRVMYGRYDCSPNAHLIVTGTDGEIPCERDIELASGEAIDLSAVNNSNAPVTFTISLLLKNPSAANAVVGVATYYLKVSSLSGGAPSAPRAQEVLSSNLDRPAIMGATAESSRLTWENKPGERVYASYACSVQSAFLAILSEGRRVKVPPETPIPLSEAVDASVDILGSNFNTQNTAYCTITLTRKNLRTRAITALGTQTLDLQPVSSGKQQTTTSSATRSMKVSATTTAATTTPGVVFPLIENVRLTSQRIIGDALASTTLLWSTRPGAQVSASYICMPDAGIIVAGTPSTATIPCGIAFPLSVNALNLSGVNNASSTATTTITIFVEDTTRGERRGVNIPLFILPNPSVGAQSSFSRMLTALLHFFLR